MYAKQITPSEIPRPRLRPRSRVIANGLWCPLAVGVGVGEDDKLGSGFDEVEDEVVFEMVL
jgi:hypothetical protein